MLDRVASRIGAPKVKKKIIEFFSSDLLRPLFETSKKGRNPTLYACDQAIIALLTDTKMVPECLMVDVTNVILVGVLKQIRRGGVG